MKVCKVNVLTCVSSIILFPCTCTRNSSSSVFSFKSHVHVDSPLHLVFEWLIYLWANRQVQPSVQPLLVSVSYFLSCFFSNTIDSSSLALSTLHAFTLTDQWSTCAKFDLKSSFTSPSRDTCARTSREESERKRSKETQTSHFLPRTQDNTGDLKGPRKM